MMFSLCCVFSCKNPTESSDYDDLEIDIIRTKTVYNYSYIDQVATRLRHAVIEFTVENTGTKNINGWKIFFKVQLQHNREIELYQKKYYKLKGGEISSKQSITSAYLPPEYGSPVSSSVYNVKVW